MSASLSTSTGAYVLAVFRAVSEMKLNRSGTALRTGPNTVEARPAGLLEVVISRLATVRFARAVPRNWPPTDALG